jgi:hypothetical protein
MAGRFAAALFRRLKARPREATQTRPLLDHPSSERREDSR